MPGIVALLIVRRAHLVARAAAPRLR
jgi:hypothetical protein